MRSVMIDNWTMMELVSAWLQRGEVPFQYHEFLSALVLWDRVLYPNNGFTQWNNIENPFSVALTCVEGNDKQYLLKAHEIVGQIKGQSKIPTGIIEQGHFAWIQENILGDEHDLVAESAISYWLYCQDLSCDYLPSPERRDFMRRFYHSSKNLLDYYRLGVMNQFDTAWSDSINEIYEILGRTDIRIEFPILSNYIIHNRDRNMSLIDSALHMSELSEFVHFRKYLDDIDAAISGQEWRKVRYLITNIRDITNRIFDLNSHDIGSIGFTILPTPSVSIDTDMRRPKITNGLSLLNNLGRFAQTEANLNLYTNDEYWDMLASDYDEQ